MIPEPGGLLGPRPAVQINLRDAEIERTIVLTR